MTFDEWYERSDIYVHDSHEYDWMQEAWDAAVEETKKACAEAVKEKIGHQWIEGHYDRFETVIINAEVK